jgi:hypothetical protein
MLNFYFQRTNTAYEVDFTQQHCYEFLRNLTPWRDSNRGILFLRRMQCRLRHTARGFTVVHCSVVIINYS